MKKIIYFFGVIFLSIIILLNIIYTATLDSSEHITITFNSLIYIAGLVIVGVLLYFGSKLLDKYLYNNEARTHFEEIESIFLELILCDYLVNNGFNKDDINEVKKIIIENLINEAKDLYFKYNINRFIHVEQIKNIDNHFFKLLYQNKNITKDELRKVYSSSYEDVTKYVISSLYALELYDKYQINKEKTIEDYKNIISLDLYTHLDYLDAIESKLIVPNESDTFIRTLKK